MGSELKRLRLHPKADDELEQLKIDDRALWGASVEAMKAVAAVDGDRWAVTYGRIRGVLASAERTALMLLYTERRDGGGIGVLGWCQPDGVTCSDGAWELARHRLDEMAASFGW